MQQTVHFNYTVSKRKRQIMLLSISSSNIDQFHISQSRVSTHLGCYTGSIFTDVFITNVPPPALGGQTTTFITMASVKPNLRLPSQPQSAAVPWLLPIYTAW